MGQAQRIANHFVMLEDCQAFGQPVPGEVHHLFYLHRLCLLGAVLDRFPYNLLRLVAEGFAMQTVERSDLFGGELQLSFSAIPSSPAPLGLPGEDKNDFTNDSQPKKE